MASFMLGFTTNHQQASIGVVADGWLYWAIYPYATTTYTDEDDIINGTGQDIVLFGRAPSPDEDEVDWHFLDVTGLDPTTQYKISVVWQSNNGTSSSNIVTNDFTTSAGYNEYELGVGPNHQYNSCNSPTVVLEYSLGFASNEQTNTSSSGETSLEYNLDCDESHQSNSCGSGALKLEYVLGFNTNHQSGSCSGHPIDVEGDLGSTPSHQNNTCCGHTLELEYDLNSDSSHQQGSSSEHPLVLEYELGYSSSHQENECSSPPIVIGGDMSFDTTHQSNSSEGRGLVLEYVLGSSACHQSNTSPAYPLDDNDTHLGSTASHQHNSSESQSLVLEYLLSKDSSHQENNSSENSLGIGYELGFSSCHGQAVDHTGPLEVDYKLSVDQCEGHATSKGQPLVLELSLSYTTSHQHATCGLFNVIDFTDVSLVIEEQSTGLIISIQKTNDNIYKDSTIMDCNKPLVWDGYDNYFTVEFINDGTPVDLSNLQKIELKIGNITLDNQTTPSAFTPLDTYKMKISLGHLGLPVGLHKVLVIAYDSASIGGTIFGSTKVLIKEAA